MSVIKQCHVALLRFPVQFNLAKKEMGGISCIPSAWNAEHLLQVGISRLFPLNEEMDCQ